MRPAGERDGRPARGRKVARTLERLVARGDAVMESRTWNSPRPVAAIRGSSGWTAPTSSTLVASREALVDGAGGLLVHDPESSTAPEDRGPASTAGFGIDGTSRFRWARRMTMNREVDDRYLVIMEREVEVLHAGIDPDDTLSLTADRLEVTLERPEEAGRSEAKARRLGWRRRPGSGGRTPDQESQRSMAAGVELGGPADLVRVRGIGRVFVRTPEHDIECSGVRLQRRYPDRDASGEPGPGGDGAVEGRGDADSRRASPVGSANRSDQDPRRRGRRSPAEGGIVSRVARVARALGACRALQLRAEAPGFKVPGQTPHAPISQPRSALLTTPSALRSAGVPGGTRPQARSRVARSARPPCRRRRGRRGSPGRERG